MAQREEILRRIRRALGRETRLAPGDRRKIPGGDLAGIMPPLEVGDWLSKFEVEFTQVGGVPHRATTTEELEGVIRTVLESAPATKVVFSRNPLLQQLQLARKLQTWGKTVTAWPTETAGGFDEGTAISAEKFRTAVFEATVGITGADFVLAETGSLVLSSLTEGSQLASLAPPVHLALYRRAQLVGSLDDVLAKLPGSPKRGLPHPGRSVVFITGTSRTADIEQVLIRGVHGPREVHAILVEDSCLK